MNNSPVNTPTESSNPWQRYVPLLAWLIAVLTLLWIPFRIIEYGYLPGGDSRRHVAKAFTSKPYTEIVLLRNYIVDHSPGWEWLLRLLHKTADWNIDSLMSFSIVSLMLCVFFAALPWLRRPEAWIAALLAQLIAIPELMIRLAQARPLLFTEGVLVAILFAWRKPILKIPSLPKIILTCIGISLSVWIHGAWYLWIIPLFAFALARAWRSVFLLAVCIGVGVIFGACLTGRPIDFLGTGLRMAAAVSREHLPSWMLVGELRPSHGEFESLVLIALIIGWRYLQNRQTLNLFSDPVFCMIVVCWILGLKADRSWADWGVPALLVWLTIQFEEILPTLYSFDAPRRLVICGLLALPLFIQATNDLDRRFTFSNNEYFLDANDASLKGWLPENNGIFYSAQMEFFYSTFYKNPNADWRYIVAFEPAIMPEDDLKIFRDIQRANFAAKAYEPWAEKMKSNDRLMLYSGAQPNLPELEWHNVSGNLWIGRTPKRLKAH